MIVRSFAWKRWFVRAKELDTLQNDPNKCNCMCFSLFFRAAGPFGFGCIQFHQPIPRSLRLGAPTFVAVGASGSMWSRASHGPTWKMSWTTKRCLKTMGSPMVTTSKLFNYNHDAMASDLQNWSEISQPIKSPKRSAGRWKRGYGYPLVI